VDDEQTWRKGVQAYLASVNFADECVGMLLDALDRSPYKDNTIIILWSDHGWHLGEKLHWSKFTLWEESARCVLLCAGPGVAAGTRCNQPVSLLDIYPTLVEMCALPAKAGLAGESFLPQLKDPACKRTKPSVTANTKGFSVRTEQWRYISYYDGSEELYDHDKDPLEWDNLAGKAELAGTKETLKVFVPKKPHPARKPDTEPKAQTKKVSQIDINPAKTQK
jgi:arylsulfatase A-like enzyme